MPNQIIIDCPQQVLAPGELVRGEVLWDLEVEPESVVLSLGWWTSGKGTRDEDIVDSVTWRAGRIGKESFSLQIPDGPYSFSGRLVSLEWALECTVKHGNAEALCSLVVSPHGAEIDISANTYESQIKSFAR